MIPRHRFVSYDDWKTTNPADEELGPEPSDDREYEYEYEDRYEDKHPSECLCNECVDDGPELPKNTP